MTNFDKSFKETGSVGAYMNDSNDGNSIDIGRFAYDNLHKFILMEIFINIVAGIIIDTFSSLKEKFLRQLEDQEG